MLFKRRKSPTRWERIRLWLWPRRSFYRSLCYMGKRILRISATPHAVASGLAVGFFMACTPLFGLHIFLALIVAWFARANLGAAAIGTAFSNPITIPFIMGIDYVIGNYVLTYFGIVAHMPLDTEVTLNNFLDVWKDLSFSDAWQPIFRPLSVGALVTGVFFAVLAYTGAYWATARYQRRRRERIAQKSKLKFLTGKISGRCT